MTKNINAIPISSKQLHSLCDEETRGSWLGFEPVVDAPSNPHSPIVARTPFCFPKVNDDLGLGHSAYP